MSFDEYCKEIGLTSFEERTAAEHAWDAALCEASRIVCESRASVARITGDFDLGLKAMTCKAICAISLLHTWATPVPQTSTPKPFSQP